MANGYEKTYEMVLPKLLNVEFRDASERLGFDYINEDEMEIDFLSERYLVTHKRVVCLTNPEVHINNRSVLIYYTSSEGRVQPKGDFKGLHYFTSGLMSGSRASWMTNPLVKAFGEDYLQFAKASFRFGMTDVSTKTMYIWQYSLLPKVPIQVIYFEGDDEYPTNIEVLFDDTVLSYLPFETLAVAYGLFVSRLSRQE
jgi:hypothetical protein